MQEAMEAVGPNPHYKPLVNRWRTVEIMAPVGSLVGVVLDSEDSGALCIVVSAGPEWNSSMELARGQEVHLITEEKRFFGVTAEERGPAVGHEFLPDPDAPERCLTCSLEAQVV